MLSANNVLSPAHGRPLVTPTQDMIIGAFYLTEFADDEPGAGRVFRHLYEIEQALENGDLGLHAPITYRNAEVLDLIETPANGVAAKYKITTAGRVLFNSTLPKLPVPFEFVNERVSKRKMTEIVEKLARDYPKSQVSTSLDAIKNLCFRWAAQSGLTISVDDVRTPPEKKSILDRHEKDADKVEKQFRQGIITDGERRQKEVEIWTEATDEVRRKMEELLTSTRFNPIDMMVGSGARGNMMQVTFLVTVAGNRPQRRKWARCNSLSRRAFQSAP